MYWTSQNEVSVHEIMVNIAPVRGFFHGLKRTLVIHKYTYSSLLNVNYLHDRWHEIYFAYEI